MTDASTRLAGLEARIAELEDERALRDLMATYGYYADLGLSEDWVHLFLPDGWFEVAVDPSWSRGIVQLDVDATSVPGDDIVVRHTGHEALRKFINDPLSHKQIEGLSLHLMTQNMVVEVEGDRARANSYNLTLVRQGSGINLFNGSICRWTFVRTEGRWLIESCYRRRPAAPGFQDVLARR